jgi:dephospho-CoA kinase
MNIGITGYICSGKTTYIKNLIENYENFVNINCDKYGELLLENQQVRELIYSKLYWKKELFFPFSIKINKKELSKLCFKEPEILKLIEEIIIPRVEDKVLDEINRFKFKTYLIESANIFDGFKNTLTKFNLILFIDTPFLIRLFRYIFRNKTFNIIKFFRINKIQKKKYKEEIASCFVPVIKVRGMF